MACFQENRVEETFGEVLPPPSSFGCNVATSSPAKSSWGNEIWALCSDGAQFARASVARQKKLPSVNVYLSTSKCSAVDSREKAKWLILKRGNLWIPGQELVY